MFLEKLQVHNVRAIKSADLHLSPGINLITGNNGSGKTSFLESIYLLGVGRSFRSNQVKSIINSGADSLTVFGQLSKPRADTLGLSRDKAGKSKVRINNIDQNKLSSLARYLPVLVITPDSYQLLNAGPQHRRQFLDLSVFHVEPTFSSHWQRYNRVLKQRNAQIKGCDDYSKLAIWDKEYAELAEKLNRARKTEFLQLKQHLEEIQGIFLPQYKVQYTYCSGWNDESKKTLQQQLENSFDLDKRYGYSTIGAHKADIKIVVDNNVAQEVLSRGEQKMLVNAMHLAQAKRLAQDLDKNCLLLVDDLPSEIDSEKQKIMLTELSNLPNVQLFITAISARDLSDESFNQQAMPIKVFHVEQGNIKSIEN